MGFNTVEELVEHINNVSKYVERSYRGIAREIREKGGVVFLTSGWLKSPGCSSMIASSLLRRIDTYHTDLGFFTRYIAPYHETRERDLGLIVYDNPVEPWRSYIVRHIRSLSLLGLGGVFIKAGRISVDKEKSGDAENGFDVIEVPGDVDILLAHHMLSLRAILEVSSERAMSPRIARILDELRGLSSIAPDMVKKYGEIVREIRTKVQGGKAVAIATCISRSFFEGLLLDRLVAFVLHEAQELQGLPGLNDNQIVIAYVEAEKDLLPVSVRTGKITELVLKTDPVISPIYFRLLSMLSIILPAL